MKNVFLIISLLVTAPTFGANWYCTGQCELICEAGNTRYDISGRGTTRGSAQGEAKQSCTQLWYQNAGSCSSYLPWLSDYDCRELAPPPAQHFSLIYKNNCRKHGQIASAVHYKDLSGNWVSDGFWVLAHGETATVAFTKNRTYYIHAHVMNGVNVSWGNGHGPWTVRGESLNFGIVTIPNDAQVGPYTFNFNCD